jgi:hypothetical protein
MERGVAVAVAGTGYIDICLPIIVKNGPILDPFIFVYRTQEFSFENSDNRGRRRWV